MPATGALAQKDSGMNTSVQTGFLMPWLKATKAVFVLYHVTNNVTRQDKVRDIFQATQPTKPYWASYHF